MQEEIQWEAKEKHKHLQEFHLSVNMIITLIPKIDYWLIT